MCPLDLDAIWPRMAPPEDAPDIGPLVLLPSSSSSSSSLSCSVSGDNGHDNHAEHDLFFYCQRRSVHFNRADEHQDNGPLPPIAVHAHINRLLQPYQRHGVRWMFDAVAANRGAILGTLE